MPCLAQASLWRWYWSRLSPAAPSSRPWEYQSALRQSSLFMLAQPASRVAASRRAREVVARMGEGFGGGYGAECKGKWPGWAAPGAASARRWAGARHGGDGDLLAVAHHVHVDGVPRHLVG